MVNAVGGARRPKRSLQRGFAAGDLLRQLYPDINIQVFYQKDFENLIFKYGLAERPVQV